MKKSFVALLALVFIFGVGCSSSDATHNGNSELTATAVVAGTADSDDGTVAKSTPSEETVKEPAGVLKSSDEVAVEKEMNANLKKADDTTNSEIGDVIWTQFNAGIKQAKSQKKHMIVDFYTDWCHWCKVMDEKTFSDKDVSQKLAKRFVTVRLNAEAQDEMLTYKGQDFSNAQFTKAVRVTGFPSLGFFDKDGEMVTIIPGYVPPESFIHILGYIDGEYYKKDIPFEDYVKQQES